MIKAEILYKNGKVENKSFRDSGQYIKYINDHHAEIRIVTADDIRPLQIKGQREGVRKCDAQNAEAKAK